jgi:dolichol kinase
MPLRFHREGKFRTRLGKALGGDRELGDRAWRRCLHGAGALVLLYYVLPSNFFLIASNLTFLLAALAAVLLLEALRLLKAAELPTIRPHEQRRIASYVVFAIALVIAVLLFPRPIAIIVVLGTSFVDPLIGELRVRRVRKLGRVLVPVVVYAAMATAVGWWLAGLVPAWATIAGVLGAVVAVAVEAPRAIWMDDDLSMTLVPGAILWGVAYVVPALSGLHS